LEKKVAELEGVIGKKTLELDFSPVPCEGSGSHARRRQDWRDSIYTEIRGWMQSQVD